MNTQPITSFRGPYRFLSNFWLAYVKLDDMWFDSVEHAYVAAKTLDTEIRKQVQAVKRPGDVKKLGRMIKLRPDWEQVKYNIMLGLVRQKFQNSMLRQSLLDTDEAWLEEGNTWHDQYWGICHCDRCGGKGQNNLGKILMQVREEIRSVSALTV
jgi:ribA/ribD-fused uncharacterized protein